MAQTNVKFALNHMVCPRWTPLQLIETAAEMGVGAVELRNDVGDMLRLRKRLAAVQDCRTVKKSHMVHNAYTPKMEIDAQTYDVRADGVLLTCEPASVLPMAQRYFLF